MYIQILFVFHAKICEIMCLAIMGSSCNNFDTCVLINEEICIPWMTYLNNPLFYEEKGSKH